MIVFLKLKADVIVALFEFLPQHVVLDVMLDVDSQIYFVSYCEIVTPPEAYFSVPTLFR